MKIIILPKFIRQFKKLPPEIRAIAIEKEKIFRENHFDPRLKTHKLHGALSEFYAFSITHSYRIIFELCDDEHIRFYSIGNHDIYE